ncbi:hypothetical protein DPX16_11619 [Anabarilius grahami]|uniref:Uncharacterized protein n=1 Tax=Anabarilius grahami TaxID=495550 RepID=A0A3N0Z4I6_ANAGA|nr:hypothetical protein DPX16_11619 [Anabarilius grahami]
MLDRVVRARGRDGTSATAPQSAAGVPMHPMKTYPRERETERDQQARMDSGCGLMELCMTIPTGALQNLTIMVDQRTVWRSAGPVRIQSDF